MEFGWHVIIPTPYGQKLLDGVSDLATECEWQIGVYETGKAINSAIDLNTNAAVLQALHYKANEPLFAL